MRKLVMAIVLRAALWTGRNRRPASPTGLTETRATRILVVELWNIGDVILTMPFLAQLRALFPAAEITLLSQPHAKTLLEGTHLVDRVIDTRLTWRDNENRISPFAYDWAELLRTTRRIKKEKFDIAFQSKLHFREHVLLAASGAPRRLGYSLESGLGSALTDEISPVPNRQRVADWLELLRPFGGPLRIESPRLSVSAEESEWADSFLLAQGIGRTDVVVGVHAGASTPTKRWPLEKFAEVTEFLASQSAVRTLVFAEPGGYGASLAQGLQVAHARVGLRELIALISRCNLLLCNDSGPMHIAGALDVPTVAIFATGIERAFSPLGSGHYLVTSVRESADADASESAVEHIPTAEVRAALDAALASVLSSHYRRGRNLASAKCQ